jgi:hypothetical protein
LFYSSPSFCVTAKDRRYCAKESYGFITLMQFNTMEAIYQSAGAIDYSTKFFDLNKYK